MDSNYNKFRKATFGGFNRKDVIDYIEKIQNEFFDYKTETEKTVKKLHEKINELERLTAGELQIAETEEKTETSEFAPANEINEATDKLKNVTDELCRSLTDFIEKLSENSISVMLDIPYEENSDDENYDIECEKDKQEEPFNKVESILSSVSSIFTLAQKNETSAENKASVDMKANKSIKDILNSASFIC